MASLDGSRSLQVSSDENVECECGPCEYEGIKREAKFFCPECGDYLCDSCKSSHQKLSISRKHQVLLGNEMPKKSDSLREVHKENTVLCSCNGKGVTSFCKDHNEVICVECKTLKHRNCQCIFVEEASMNIEVSCEETVMNVNKSKDKVEKLMASRTEDIHDLTAQTTESQDAVKGFKTKLTEQLDKMEMHTLDEITKLDNEQRTIIQRHIDNCHLALNKLNLDYKSFESARTTCDQQIIFVRNLRLANTLTHIDSLLEDINKEVKKPGISFQCDKSVTKTDSLGLGTVKSNQASTTNVGSDITTDGRGLGTVEPRKRTRAIIDMAITSSTTVDVANLTDVRVPLISGSVFLTTGELVLCDFNNCSLKLLTVEFTLKQSMSLSEKPWGVTVVSDNMVIVSSHIKKSLLFVKVYPTLEAGSSIQLEYPCHGVAVADGLIYTCLSNGEMRVFDQTNKQIKTVHKVDAFSNVAVGPTGVVYVSENNNDRVRAFNHGTEIFKYTDNNLKHPLGMYVDSDDNVLVCGFNSHNVQVIDKNGKLVKILLSQTDGLYSPYTISFRQSDKKLFVGGSTRQKMLVFTMG